MKQFGLELGFDIAHIETNNWNLGREMTARLELRYGYDLSAYCVDTMIEELDNRIIGGDEIEVQPYDHSTGKPTVETLSIEPAEIVVLDGAISMVDIFVEGYGVQACFFDAMRTLSRELKYHMNLCERGYDRFHALRDAIVHEARYRDLCRVERKNANWIIELRDFGKRREYWVMKSPACQLGATRQRLKQTPFNISMNFLRELTLTHLSKIAPLPDPLVLDLPEKLLALGCVVQNANQQGLRISDASRYKLRCFRSLLL